MRELIERLMEGSFRTASDQVDNENANKWASSNAGRLANEFAKMAGVKIGKKIKKPMEPMSYLYDGVWRTDGDDILVGYRKSDGGHGSFGLNFSLFKVAGTHSVDVMKIAGIHVPFAANKFLTPKWGKLRKQ